MVIDERGRYAMYAKLQELMGEEDAAVLMEHLPPTGWADVATKRDLDANAAATKRDLDSLGTQLRTELRAELSEVRKEFAEALHAQTRTLVTWLLTAMALSTVSVGSIAFAAARLI